MDDNFVSSNSEICLKLNLEKGRRESMRDFVVKYKTGKKIVVIRNQQKNNSVTVKIKRPKRTFFVLLTDDSWVLAQNIFV